MYCICIYVPEARVIENDDITWVYRLLDIFVALILIDPENWSEKGYRWHHYKWLICHHTLDIHQGSRKSSVHRKVPSCLRKSEDLHMCYLNNEKLIHGSEKAVMLEVLYLRELRRFECFRRMHVFLRPPDIALVLFTALQEGKALLISRPEEQGNFPSPLTKYRHSRWKHRLPLYIPGQFFSLHTKPNRIQILISISTTYF